jgi:hypothetical protein
MSGHHSHDLLYGILLLAGFLAAAALMVWDIGRQCEKAQHEVELDELWDDDEEVATC